MGQCLTGSAHTVMAINTTVSGLAMVKGNNQSAPYRTDMTGFTKIACHRMGGRFQGPGTYAIVASTTGT